MGSAEEWTWAGGENPCEGSISDALQAVGNSRTEGRAPVPPWGHCLQNGHTLIKVFIFHKVAWPCPPGLTGMNTHLMPSCSTLKSFKLNTKGQPALGAGPKTTPLASERRTLKALPGHMSKNLQK